MNELKATTRFAPSNHDPSSEDTPKPEIIGEYVQSLPTTIRDCYNVPYAIEASTYSVVGIISRDRTWLAEAGVVLRAREEETGEVKKLEQFRDVTELFKLAKAGMFSLSQPEVKQETLRMEMRR